MPEFDYLEEGEIAAVIDYLRKINQPWPFKLYSMIATIRELRGEVAHHAK
jgi:hypothetical protein